VFEVGANRAVALIAEKRAGGGRGAGGRSAPAALKELGPHPVSGDPIRVLSGRYGPYVNAGKINANVPKTTEPAALTIEEAVKLLDERAAKTGTGKTGTGQTGGNAAKAPAKSTKAAAKPASKTKTAGAAPKAKKTATGKA
jgi:DNA topoisomerase-1